MYRVKLLLLICDGTRCQNSRSAHRMGNSEFCLAPIQHVYTTSYGTRESYCPLTSVPYPLYAKKHHVVTVRGALASPVCVQLILKAAT